MAINRGPNIVQDGLVFGYDADDRSSRFYKGEPTTNLISNHSFGTGWSFKLATFTLVDNIAIFIEANGDSYSYYSYNFGTDVSGNIFSASCDMKTLDCEKQKGLSIYWKNNSGSWIFQNNIWDLAISNTGSTYSTDWKRLNVTAIAPANTYQVVFFLGFGSTVVSDFNGKCYVKNVQLEAKSHSTQFTNSTRSVTDSLIDLKRSTTIDLSDISFDWSAHPYFDGTNVIQTTYAPNFSDFTICVWFKDENTPLWGRLVDKLYSAGLYMTSYYNGNKNYVGAGIIEPNSPYGIGLPYSAGDYHYFVSSRNGTTHNIYLDGITQKNSKTGSTSLLDNTSFAFGCWSNSASSQVFKGKLPIVHIYNRALSESEILQNYNAQKERFAFENKMNENLQLHLDAGNKNSYPTSGTIWYDIKGTNNGTLNGGTTFSELGGGTLVFDGTTGCVLLNSSINLGNGNISWSVITWVKTTTTVNRLGLGSVLSNSSGGPVYSMMGVNGGKIVYWTYHSGWFSNLGNITVNDNNWHQLVWVNYSNNTMDMYVDNVLDISGINSTSGNNNPVNIIGGSWGGKFDGSIAVLKIYQNRALTIDEITQLFNKDKKRFNL